MKRFKAIEIFRESCSDRDVLFDVRWDEFREAGVGEKTDTGATDRGPAGERNHRNTHPQRIARRRAAVVGKRVECDIDAEIRAAIVDGVLPADEFQSLAGDAAVSEQLAHVLRVTPRLAVKQESRIR